MQSPAQSTSTAHAFSLHQACVVGDYTVVQRLLEGCAWRKPDVNEVVEGGNGLMCTPLIAACNNGSLDTVRLLLQHGAEVDLATTKGCTPLHFACHNGHEDVAKQLLSQGADPMKAARDGRTPVDFARGNGHEDIVKLLSEHGIVDPEAAKADKADAAMLALAGKKGKKKKKGKKSFSQERVLHEAWVRVSVVGDCTEAQRLLDARADVNGFVKADNGMICTPLYFACRYGHLDTVRLLLQHGAEVDTVNNQGATPLHFACRAGHLAVAKLLLAEGAQVDKVDDHGDTPLQWACHQGHLGVAKLLLAHGADPMKAAMNGTTPLPVSF